MEIVTNIKNYKKIISYELDVQNANLIIVSGKNEVGKTSLITFIREMVNAKKISLDPLREGEKEAGGTGQLKDKDGNTVFISVVINEDKKYKFTLLTSEGKKITDPKTIREIMGISTYMTTEEFTRNCLTAKGKREIMEKLIYRLLPDEDMNKVLDIDKQLTTDSELFKTIHATKKELETLSIQKKTLELTEDENIILNQSDEIEKEINNIKGFTSEFEAYQEAIENAKAYGANKDVRLNEFNNELNTLKEDYEAELARLKQRYEERCNTVNNKKDLFLAECKKHETLPPLPKYNKEQYEENKIKLDKLEKALLKKEVVEEKMQKLTTLTSQITPKMKLLSEKETEKEKLKDEKLALLRKVDIPNLTFDENTFFIEGREIDDTSICESKRAMVLIDLLCRRELNETPYLFVGNVNVFDRDRLREVVQNCIKHGKTPFFEKVGDTQDITVFTQIEDI